MQLKLYIHEATKVVSTLISRSDVGLGFLVDGLRTSHGRFLNMLSEFLWSREGLWNNTSFLEQVGHTIASSCTNTEPVLRSLEIKVNILVWLHTFGFFFRPKRNRHWVVGSKNLDRQGVSGLFRV